MNTEVAEAQKKVDEAETQSKEAADTVDKAAASMDEYEREAGIVQERDRLQRELEKANADLERTRERKSYLATLQRRLEDALNLAKHNQKEQDDLLKDIQEIKKGSIMKDLTAHITKLRSKVELLQKQGAPDR